MYTIAAQLKALTGKLRDSAVLTSQNNSLEYSLPTNTSNIVHIL